MKSPKKIILYGILFLIVIGVALAATQTFWEAVGSGNLLYINALGDEHQTSALTGWYEVENWEVETCTRGQTSDFENSDQANKGVFSQNNLIVGLTLSVQAYQHLFEEDPTHKEYEVAWYIQPFSEEIDYNMQYQVEGNDWKEFDPAIENTAGPQNGDKGYLAWSGSENITKIRIRSSEDTLEIPVVNKNENE